MMQAFTSQFGAKMIDIIKFFGSVSILLRDSFKELRRPPFYLNLTLEQIHQIGIKSLSLVIAAALSTGMVMSLQFGLGLEKFGGKLYVPKIVSLSIVRELGPIFTSLMIAGRVGAGIASEIGSMVVTQQIDAIRALGTSPLKKIVIPRILACMIALPLLSVVANTVGIFGAMFVGSMELGLDAGFFFHKVASTVTTIDYTVGILKTIFFSFIISATACYFGLNVSEGTRGVGIATTKSVVTSSILIVVSDYFLTKLFWILFEQWIT